MPTKQVSTSKYLSGLVPIACAVAIFWLSILKAPAIFESKHWFWGNLDKLGHAIAYAALAGSMFWAYRLIKSPAKYPKSVLIGFALLAFLYSLSLELVQWFLPHRTFDPLDLVANATGIFLAAILFVRVFIPREVQFLLKKQKM